MRGALDHRVKAMVAATYLRGRTRVCVGQVACQELMQHHAYGKDVGALVDRERWTQNFRRGVAGCAEDLLALFDLALQRPRQAKIPDFRVHLAVEQDIGRFDVPVQDPVFMGVCEAVTYTDDQIDSVRMFDRKAMCRVVKGLPRHKLHHDEKQPLHLAEIVHADQVRMVQFRHRLRLGFKAGTEHGVR